MNFAFEVERPSPSTRRTAARKTASNWYETGSSPGVWTNYADFANKPATTRGWVYDASQVQGSVAEGLRETYGDADWVWEVTNQARVVASGTASSREEAQSAAEQAAQGLNSSASRKHSYGEGYSTDDWSQGWASVAGHGNGPSVWGEYIKPDGTVVRAYRKGQKVRFYDAEGNQHGPEQANVAPAMAYAESQGWYDPDSVRNRFGPIGGSRKTAESDYERGRRAWEEHNERSKQGDPDADPLDAPQFQEGSEEFKQGWMDAAEGMTREERERDVAETDRILDEIARGDREVREAKKETSMDRTATLEVGDSVEFMLAEGGRTRYLPGKVVAIDGDVVTVSSAWLGKTVTVPVSDVDKADLSLNNPDLYQEAQMDRTSLRQREADILAAMANANLQERRKLAQELNDVQRQRREAIQADRDVDLADTVIRDTLTPVMAHSRSTEDTDWLGEVGLTTEAARDDVHRKMTAEATMWFRNLHEAVIADVEEFAEQAKGKARAVASGYDLIREEAVQAFLDQAAHLHRKAEVDWEGETGDGAADVSDVPTPGQEIADYPQPDTSSNTDDDFGDDDADKGSKESAKTAGETVAWSGELPDCDICKTEFTSSAPNKAQFDGKTAMGPWAYMCQEHFQALGIGLGTGQGQRLVKEEAKNADMNPPSDDLVDTDIDRYYGNPEGIEGPDTDSQSGHGETQAPANPDEEPAFDDASFDEDPPKERANQATSPPPGESSRGNDFRPSYSRRKTAEEGQKWVAEVTGNGENRWSRNALVFDTKEEAEQWLSGLKMRWFGYDMGRVVPADTPRDQSVSETGTEGIYQNFRSGSRKTAARPLHEIARDIESEWDNVNFAARPYLDAMKTLDSINDNYMYDSARSIVAYFLSNASSFRGERAKELKAELKALSKRSSKTAAEGDTCAVCGDSIARDDAKENPSTWHHDNGEKHDHEAKPASSGKESGLLQVTDPQRFQAFAERLREQPRGSLQPDCRER